MFIGVIFTFNFAKFIEKIFRATILKNCWLRSDEDLTLMIMYLGRRRRSTMSRKDITTLGITNKLLHYNFIDVGFSWHTFLKIEDLFMLKDIHWMYQTEQDIPRMPNNFHFNEIEMNYFKVGKLSNNLSFGFNSLILCFVWTCKLMEQESCWKFNLCIKTFSNSFEIEFS